MNTILEYEHQKSAVVGFVTTLCQSSLTVADRYGRLCIMQDTTRRHTTVIGYHTTVIRYHKPIPALHNCALCYIFSHSCPKLTTDYSDHGARNYFAQTVFIHCSSGVAFESEHERFPSNRHHWSLYQPLSRATAGRFQFKIHHSEKWL